MKKLRINTIFFDVFGTVFDWHKSIHDEAKKFTIENKITLTNFILLTDGEKDLEIYSQK